MKAIIFDFDGVIHDTFDFHRKKVKEFTGYELGGQMYRDIHNGNFFDSIPEEFKNINWIEYGDFIHDEQSTLKADEEIKDIILKLSLRYDLYVASSGLEKNILNYFKNNDIDFCFKGIFGRDYHVSKVEKFKYIFDRYNLTTSNCIFVTDTLGDILEANEIGLKTIAVDYGFHDRDKLEIGKPYKIISNFKELLLLE